MNIEEAKKRSEKGNSDWEDELWSYINRGDGITCPILDECEAKKIYGECPDLHRKHIRPLIDKEDIDLHHFDFITNSRKYTVSCRIFQIIEKLAWKYISTGEINNPPIPYQLIHLLDTENHIVIREVPLKSLYSAIWYESDSWVIQLKNSAPDSVKRYSLFHEGFHILAHTNTKPIFKKRGIDKGAFNELLAGYFAGCILMPKKWLIEKWEQLKDIDSMATIFGVTRSSIYIRLRQFGLIA